MVIAKVADVSGLRDIISEGSLREALDILN